MIAVHGEGPERYETIEEFYRAHPLARTSGESDFGVWWKDDRGEPWRVTYVHQTGHVYGLYGGRPARGPVTAGGRRLLPAGSLTRAVVVLGRLDPRPEEHDWGEEDPADRLFAGWAKLCGKAGSLEWVLRRLENAPR